MPFLKRLDPEDFTVITDSVTSTCWSNAVTSLTSFYTSTNQILNNNPYLSIYQTSSNLDAVKVQFDITYGNKNGSGSEYYYNGVEGYSSTRTIYGQYRNLVLGDERQDFIFGNTRSSDFYVISINRELYKQSLLPGSLSLKLSGLGNTNTTFGPELISNGDFNGSTTGWTIFGGISYNPTNNYLDISGPGILIQSGLTITPGKSYVLNFDFFALSGFNSGQSISAALGGTGGNVEVFDITSLGSHSVSFALVAGSTLNSITIIFNGALSGYIDNISLKETINNICITDNSLIAPTLQFCDAGRIYLLVSGSQGTVDSGSYPFNGYAGNSQPYGYFLPDIGTILLNPSTLPFTTLQSDNIYDNNLERLLEALNSGSEFILNNQETISSNCVFVRVRNNDFNYSENPSFISSSNGVLTFNSMIEHPQTFPTTVGLYNDTNDLVAVAKVSKPLLKNFTTEALIKVKLDF